MENDSEVKVDRWVEERLTSATPPAGWEPDAAEGLQRFRQGRQSRRARNRKLAWTGAAVTILGAGALMFPATRVVAQRCVDACLGVSRPEGIIPPGSRSMAPDFSLPGDAGSVVRLADLHGQVVLLNFWATWCTPCNVEIPWFADLQQQHGGAGFTVLGISMDEDGWTSVKPYLERSPLNYRIAVGGDAVAQSYGGIEALPTTFLIDRAGRIAVIQRGLTPKGTYEDEIRSLLNEK
jgi:cytochrome c biogenesis protein CcmG/thiol:disulfide interchange protein DsbE